MDELMELLEVLEATVTEATEEILVAAEYESTSGVLREVRRYFGDFTQYNAVVDGLAAHSL